MSGSDLCLAITITRRGCGGCSVVSGGTGAILTCCIDTPLCVQSTAVLAVWIPGKTQVIL